MPDQTPAILALAGYAGAGKDTFAALLKTQFEATGKTTTLVSSGDLIRQYVRDHDLGDPGDRALLRQVVDDVAKTQGYTYWLEQSIAQAVAGSIDILLYPGLRQQVEVEFLHRRGDQIAIIEVPLETRYERSKQRGRPGDDISLETFKANEAAERAGTAQQIEAVIAAADITIINDGTLEQLTAVAARMAQDFPALKPRYSTTDL
jgi:dephospho-CoA kinase